ncbi:MAG: hypothetical protein P8M20_03655 [Planctomycetaceae bacterium]|nr:hypothetical protein [Planctomycetaceae bacterium]
MATPIPASTFTKQKRLNCSRNTKHTKCFTELAKSELEDGRFFVVGGLGYRPCERAAGGASPDLNDRLRYYSLTRDASTELMAV